MITHHAEIACFGEMGEKTGWNYVFIPASIAAQIKPGFKRSFRVQGAIDAVEIKGVALLPFGEGNFILALNAPLRKQLNKGVGNKIILHLEEDTTFKIELPEDLEMCLSDEQHLMDNFLKQPKSHQNYYIKWINEAKTETTRVKRIGLTVKAMDLGMNFGEMMRAEKSNR